MNGITIRFGIPEAALGADFRAVVRTVYPAASPRHAQPEPLDHPYCFGALVAYENGRPVGRCLLYDNPHLMHEGAPVLLVGNWESTRNEWVAEALLRAAEDKARALGKAWVIGPMNGSTWDAYRFFSSGVPGGHYSSEPVQHHYYAQLFKDAGFHAIHSYVTLAAPVSKQNSASLYRWPDMLTEPGIRLRALTPDTFTTDVRNLYPLCSRAFAEAPFFSPVSEEEFVRRYLPLQPMLDAGYSIIAEGEDGEKPLAFLLAFPDSFYPQRVVLKSVAKNPSCRVKGLMSAMVSRLVQAAAEDGRTEVLHAFIHEGNERSLARSREFGGEPFRRYTLYAKKVDA